LVHYDTYADFDSRSKLGGNGRAFEVVHLWGASPYAHLFREGDPGQLVVEAQARSAALPFDDGKVSMDIAANAPLSEFQLANGLTEQQVAFNDDVTRAYVLHQANARCVAAIRVYDLVNDEWIDSIPLRWRPKAIAMVGGASPSSSDDMLAVVYENSYVVYGSSDVLVSYIDINDPDPEEDPASFYGYGVTHSNPSMVQGSRHAVLYQLEVVNEGSLISAWSPQGNMSTYQDCESGETSCTNPRNIDLWRARAELGEMPAMILKSGDDIRVLQFTEGESSFTFEEPFETYTLDESVINAGGPLYFSPDKQLFTLGLNENTALFRRSTQAYTEGKASDFLPLTMDVATWS
ncbi:MAG: hypothetical protein R3330_19335, partial [Saprospiraceae bacterium]|nr:hypothetical protein [Saprospiraceae bacterium]